MITMIETLKRTYWRSREDFNNWRKYNHPHEIRKRAAIRLRAWRNPIVESDGVRLYRGTGLTIAILRVLEAGTYEAPEARIVRHAIQSGDTVLELGTGLGFLASLCAKVVGDSRVHTYEANPALGPVIQKNFRLNHISPHLNICMLGEKNSSITFYVMKNFWSSSTIKRHPNAKAIQVPMKRFNDELARLQPSFLIIDIEGGERDFIRYAQLDGVQKICIELHPHIIGVAAVAEVESYFKMQGFREEPTVSDPDHKLYLRELRN